MTVPQFSDFWKLSIQQPSKMELAHGIRTFELDIYRICRVLVELAQLQDDEVGDGTTSVVILAAELLKVKIFEDIIHDNI